MSHPLFYRTPTNNYAPIPYVFNTAAGTVEPATQQTSSQLLKIVNVSATSNDGNVPTNVIDGNPATRWSAQGVGQKLMLDLATIAPQEIHRLEITWYGQRQSYADILVDNVKSNSIVGQTSVPTTIIPFPANTRGKVVTVVGNGNSINDWNSIVEVKLYGLQTSTPVPPTPGNTGNDAFGSKMIYPTKSGGRVFNAPLNVGSQRILKSNQRDGSSDLIPLGNATYTIIPSAQEMKIVGSAPRVYVYDSARSKLFENVEVTCFYKRIAGNLASYQGFEIGVRGQHELAGTNARVYYARHSVSGTWWRMKEDVHPTSKDVSVKTGVTFSANVWYGMKFVVRTMGTDVRMESYQDLTDGRNGGTWTLMNDFTDTARAPWAGYPIYKPGTANCACRSVFVRTDNATDFRIKKFTIREI